MLSFNINIEKHSKSVLFCALDGLSVVSEEQQVFEIMEAFGGMVYRQAEVDPPINGICKHLLHVVQVRLGHIDAVETLEAGKQRHEMIAFAAEVHDAAVFFQDPTIVGRDELLEEGGGEVHGRIVS